MTTRIEITFDTRDAALAYWADRMAEKRCESVRFRDSVVPAVFVTSAEVGEPATYSIGTDRYAGRIIATTRATVTFAFDYDRERTIRASRRKDGYFRPPGTGSGSISFGFAEDYRDPSF